MTTSTMMIETTTRLATARRDLAVCRKAHAHLGLGGQLANKGRIAALVDLVQTLETLAAIVEADGGVWTDDGEFLAVA